jgi:hypothetical protein
VIVPPPALPGVKAILAEPSPAVAINEVGALGAIGAITVVTAEVPVAVPVPLVETTTERMKVDTSAAVKT